MAAFKADFVLVGLGIGDSMPGLKALNLLSVDQLLKIMEERGSSTAVPLGGSPGLGMSRVVVVMTCFLTLSSKPRCFWTSVMIFLQSLK